MNAAIGTSPLVDPEVLRELEAQLCSHAAVQQFVVSFIQLWEGRYARICTAVYRHEIADALDAALSLKAACLMVGATRLAGIAAEVEAIIRLHGPAYAVSRLRSLRLSGDATVSQLRDSYLGFPRTEGTEL